MISHTKMHYQTCLHQNKKDKSSIREGKSDETMIYKQRKDCFIIGNSILILVLVSKSIT